MMTVVIIWSCSSLASLSLSLSLSSFLAGPIETFLRLPPPKFKECRDGGEERRSDLSFNGERTPFRPVADARSAHEVDTVDAKEHGS